MLNNKNAAEGDFSITNNPTVLGSFLATGLNMNEGANASASDSGSATKTANTIPGMSGVGPGVDSHSDDGSSSSSSAAASQATGTGSAATGFVQGHSGASAVQPEKVLGGSMFAVIVAIVGLCIL